MTIETTPNTLEVATSYNGYTVTAIIDNFLVNQYCYWLYVFFTGQSVGCSPFPHQTPVYNISYREAGTDGYSSAFTLSRPLENGSFYIVMFCDHSLFYNFTITVKGRIFFYFVVTFFLSQ